MHEEKKALTEAIHTLIHEIRALTNAIVGTRPPADCLTKHDLENTETRIIMKQSEVAAQLRKVADELKKVGTETATLQKKIVDLQTAVENQDNASDELTAAAQAVADQAKIVDDLVADPTPES